VDLIDGAGRRAVIFHITEVRPHCVKLSEVLFRAACCIEDTVKKMKDPKAVSAGNRQLNLLEEEGDAIYHDGMGVLFMNATDAILVVKWKELFDRIEDAVSVTTVCTPATSFCSRDWISPVRVEVKKRSDIACKCA